MGRTRAPLVFFAVLLVAGVAFWFRQPQPAPTAATPRTTITRSTPAEVPQTSAINEASRDRALQSIADPDERRDVESMVALIDRGGPFRYPNDGAIFGNRERRLPQKSRRYYREYTVPSPGDRTRGARRIIRGAEGETYYTRDHYGSFVRIDG